MRRFILAFAFVALAAPAAFADDTRVRTSASVEVLDDKAQIDDVISRVRQEQAQHAAAQAASAGKASAVNAATLKAERPPAPSAVDASHRAIAPETKEPRPGARRTNTRTANPTAERPHVVHRR